MGGRGASFGVYYINGVPHKYGEEFTKIAQSGEIMYVKHNGTSVTAPMETRTRGRIYVTLDKDNNVKHITFYDKETGERIKQIDVRGRKHNGMIPHTHLGYEHDEHGTRQLNPKEQKIVDRIIDDWNSKRKRLKM